MYNLFYKKTTNNHIKTVIPAVTAAQAFPTITQVQQVPPKFNSPAVTAVKPLTFPATVAVKSTFDLYSPSPFKEDPESETINLSFMEYQILGVIES